MAATAQASRQHQLSVEAVARVWLLVRFTDGHAEEMLMQPGETKVWDFSEQLVMKLGNAGGIRLSLDGSDLGAPGKAGEVKTITLPAQ
jgi:cytoskeleton protein RodZ